VATALALKPTGEEQARVGAHPTENVKAYDLYLQGRNVLRNSHDVDGIRPAVALFEQAIDKDPNFALAYTGLADSSLRMYVPLPPQPIRPDGSRTNLARRTLAVVHDFNVSPGDHS
jgi:serine/threonine-protein kinase